MKVQGPSRPNVAQLQDKAHAIKNTGGAQVEKSAGERVEVSSLSKVLASVRAPDTPDIDKVERLRESIRVGEFQVDHTKVADTMMQEEV
jgi:flagellar biosynthesis anti-sigma factor FlgM